MQLLRFSHAEGGFSVLFDIEPGALDCSWFDVGREFRDDAIYYVRLRRLLRATSPPGHVRGRTVTAWLSPVWVTRAR